MTIEVQQQRRGGMALLPAGFRFHPTDEELIVHYLRKRASNSSAPWPGVIAEVDIYKLDPWDLPSSSNGAAEYLSNNECMYFFSPRDRKYPNGVRPNRAAGSGYWKATGTDKPIMSTTHRVVVGVKKALVFYQGRPPKGVKTNWIMHEYRLADARPHAYRPPPMRSSASSAPSMRLDDWVLCRIYKKPNPQLSQLLLHHEHEQPSSSSMDSQQHTQHQQDHYDSSSSTSRMRMPMPMPMQMPMPRPPSVSDYLEDYSAVSHLFDNLPAPDTGAGFFEDDEASTTRKRDSSEGGVDHTFRSASKRSMLIGPDQLTMNSDFSMFGADQQLLPANSSKDRM
ncbi:NAC transcription factor 29 [Brachypodium distachyon]|uniref:NAC domain-containing protein n=1 Tax=Brachypodium distachyon TaxID=15368 RepID=I1HC42_BRADI|nr:NAC transcription factor 29 [Brachypodium distachyon]KQK02753.1 hypothetical protein BRADI_2g03467v3 [Brachypodium distachyon]|eukprot:XP_003565352.1 NAC transcription factor 29 [Brachypodium distachyon]